MGFNEELAKPNSHKIVLLEMDIPLDATFVNVEPGMWGFNPSPGEEDVIDDFGNVGYYGDRNGQYKNIQSLNVAGEQYIEYTSLADLRTAGKGWFYDSTIPFFYFILEDYNPPEFYVVVAPGAAIGQSFNPYDTIYFEDIIYPPRIKSLQNLSKKKDPSYYGIIQYQSPSFELDNEDGFYDDYAQLQLYNQPYRVFLTFAGLDYSEALQVYQGRIKEFSQDHTSFRMIGKDPRESLSRQLPVNTFSNSDTTLPFYFAGLDDKDDGKPVPIAFGSVINGRAYRTGAGAWTFADTTYNTIDALAVGSVVKKDGTTFAFAGTGTNGTFTGADHTDDLYVTFTQSTVANGLDVIPDCIENYEGIAYNSANYDTVEWELEKANVADTGIWIGDGHLMTCADIIEKVCNENQGIFDPLPSGKYTFRTYQKLRFPTFEIYEYEKLDDGMLTHPTDEILSSIKIAYSQDLLEKQYIYVDNVDYQDAVYGIMGSYRTQKKPYETNLTSKADAQALSVTIMEQNNTVPNIISFSTKIQNIKMRLLDSALYYHKRQSGKSILPRSRYQVLSIGINLSDFGMDFVLKQIEEDDSIYMILDGGDSETAYDYYGGATSLVRPDHIFMGRNATWQA